MRCRGEGRLYSDGCGQSCTCYHGWFYCCRIRKEIHSMTRSERQLFIDTFKTASRRPDFKALVRRHQQRFGTTIHAKDHFLPWHRYYLLEIENILQQVNCRVTLPYWAWCLNANNPWGARLWGSASHWFGGNGVGSGRCVRSGPFRQGLWTLTGGGCLQRQFGNGLPTCIDVENVLCHEAGAFDTFEFQLRQWMHDTVHCEIGGTMCSGWAAEAPEFFLHHGYIDKIWNDWQEKSPAHRNVYFSTQNGNMPAGGGRSRRYLDPARLPGNVCVKYEEPTTRITMRWRQVLKKLRQALPGCAKLENVVCASTALTVNEYSAYLFGLSQSDRQRVQAVLNRRAVCPVRSTPKGAPPRYRPGAERLRESYGNLGFNVNLSYLESR